ncbi:hypothetical protein B0H11DRAFT_2213634 [Mycena galericulata]|nr:hypothetical protein B0H11DRAFT_2213634 [Mycena galericulata]
MPAHSHSASSYLWFPPPHRPTLAPPCPAPDACARVRSFFTRTRTPVFHSVLSLILARHTASHRPPPRPRPSPDAPAPSFPPLILVLVLRSPLPNAGLGLGLLLRPCAPALASTHV